MTSDNLSIVLPLHHAVLSFDLLRIIHLLSTDEHRPDVGDSHTQPALHVAVSRGFYSAVVVFLECGADVNALDEFGNTPLHVASAFGSMIHTDIINLLCRNGGDLWHRNDQEQTPYDIAHPDAIPTLEYWYDVAEDEVYAPPPPLEPVSHLSAVN